MLNRLYENVTHSIFRVKPTLNVFSWSKNESLKLAENVCCLLEIQKICQLKWSYTPVSVCHRILLLVLCETICQLVYGILHKMDNRWSKSHIEVMAEAIAQQGLCKPRPRSDVSNIHRRRLTTAEFQTCGNGDWRKRRNWYRRRL